MRRVRAVLVSTAITLALTTPRAQQPRMFVFQNNFWLNLHQFLRGEVYRRGAKLPPGLDPVSLSDVDRGKWSAALDAYAGVARRDILFDQSIVRIHNTLAGVGDVIQLPDGLVEPAVAAALNNAAPMYRARLWPTRQAANDRWIASAKALLARHETAMASMLAVAYPVPWPMDPILVDLVGETGPNSAITHRGPAGYGAHTQVSSGSSRNGGDSSLELLFHEATHAGIDDRLQQLIVDEGSRQKVAAPEDLWHAIIMFTSGVIALKELATSGATYVPYADRYNQITPVQRSALERDWRPYLDRQVSLEQALHDLVRDAR
jgi:hypothetical protein